jgi:hypothetical protein
MLRRADVRHDRALAIVAKGTDGAAIDALAAGAHRSGTIAIRSGARQTADRLKIGRAVRA